MAADPTDGSAAATLQMGPDIRSIVGHRTIDECYSEHCDNMWNLVVNLE